MIQNKVVANIKQNTNDVELRAILSEYEKKLVEMENHNMESITKFRNVIESLQKEKEELNQRLIKANHNKLQNVVLKENDKFNLTMELNREREREKTGFYLWNCGIVNSSVDMNTYLAEKKIERPNNKKLFRVEYVYDFTQSMESCISVHIKNELKSSKELTINL